MISIIGAGPSGSYLAYLLSREGYDVRVFEEHGCIGKPVQCTGLLTSAVTRIIHSEKFVRNRIRNARVYAPNGNYAGFRFRRENLVIDRTLFDCFIAEKAVQSGAEYFLGHRFVGKRNSYIVCRNKGKVKRFHTDILVGADGPNSSVAKTFSSQKREFFIGAQMTVRMANRNFIEFYPYFRDMGWVVPVSRNVARVGTASRKRPSIFADFLKFKLGNNYRKNVISHEAGLIPVFNPGIKSFYNNSQNATYLLGDAATMVKATTAGGIIQGITAAECLAETIIYRKDYENLWRQRVGRGLFLHLMIRRILDSFTESDHNRLIGMFEKERTREILNRYDRDFPAQIMLRLLWAEPSVLGYIRKLGPETLDWALLSKIPKFI